MFQKFSFLLIFFCQFILNAQDLSSLSLPTELKEDADACIRLQETQVKISTRNFMTIKSKRIVTVFNKQGLYHMDALKEYDKSSKIVSIGANIYDAFGSEVKKYKKKDFKDQSVTNETSIFTDSRVLLLDYTPTAYPFTIVFNVEIETSNTAYIPMWFPIENYNVSTEKSRINISYPPALDLKYMEHNFEDSIIEKSKEIGQLNFQNKTPLKAIKYEDFAPSFRKLVPYVQFGLNKFHYEGVDGEADSWEKFGLWVHENLLKGTDEISDETKIKIKELIGTETDSLKIAKKVIEYVQNKTRYVSVQIGIGGWKPMLAKDVDRLGYGDCKALTVYTKALLKAVGINSYYTLIYGDRYRYDINPDFVSMQGNHAVLCIPIKNELKWMECTNQLIPFDFQANFTDDRKALIIKPEGGEIIHTKIYTEELNTQDSNGYFNVKPNGDIEGKLSIKSKGTQYNQKYVLERKSKLELENYYKNYFSSINNLTIKNIDFQNDNDKIEFIETLDVAAENFVSKSGKNLIITLNAFNKFDAIPRRFRNRNLPFEISRGFTDTDKIKIELPNNSNIESIPENIEMNEKYGSYRLEISAHENYIDYYRRLTIHAGTYSKNEYEEYRNFLERVAKADNAKTVIIQN